MDFVILFVMIAVLGWNTFELYQVGFQYASPQQWGITLIMVFFVAFRIFRMLRARGAIWPKSD